MHLVPGGHYIKAKLPEEITMDDVPIKREIEKTQTRIGIFLLVMILGFGYMTVQLFMSEGIEEIKFLTFAFIFVFAIGFLGVMLSTFYLDYIARKHKYIVEILEAQIKNGPTLKGSKKKGTASK